MKTLLSIVTLIFCGCKSPTTDRLKQKIDTPIIMSTKDFMLSTITGIPKFHITKDSIIIFSNNFNYIDKTIYTKKEFNEIVDYFPSLYDSIPERPDSSYNKSGIEKQFIDSNGNIKKISFGGEAGTDSYYILYAYFLQKQNCGESLSKRRENIIFIFNKLNNIFDILYHGGTSYGHNYKRINGYAEYAVFQYKNYNNHYSESTNFKKEKNKYLKFLRQKIVMEIRIDNILPSKDEKEKERYKLLKLVANLDSLISDNFYLQESVEFQQSHY